MNSLQDRYRAARLIVRKLTGTIIPKEERELDAWAAEHRDEFAYVLEGVREELARGGTPDIVREWNSFERQAGIRKKRIKRIWYSAVAVLAGICVFTGVLLTRWTPGPEPLVATDIRQQMKDYKATLLLDDGRAIVIQDSVKRVITMTGGTEVVASGHVLRYGKTDSLPVGEIRYNTLRIPRGGEYTLVLSDGTTVWLNSESSIKYPVHFSGEQREVWMEGEVCFNVAKREQQPFVVHVDKADVKVLGTLFNVEAYPSEETITTTLVRGKVRVEQGDTGRVMMPNEQVVVKDGHFTTRKVVAEEYVRWTSGVFCFTEATLETIMEKLTRWYDVEVFFQDSSLKNIHITLEIKRYDNISVILSKMEKMGLVQFDINNKTIIVRR